MSIIVIDTETSGLDPAEGASLLEVACFEVGIDNGLYYQSFVAHKGEIPPTARAVHHISEEDVHPSRAPARAVALAPILAAVGEGAIPAAHNAVFDAQFLPDVAGPWLCTWRCALHLWPDAPGHSNQVLRYWLGVDKDPDFYVPTGLQAHRALYDAAVTAAVLRRMLRERSPEELLQLSKMPVLLETVRFGKYKGQRWQDVPYSYLKWYLGTDNQDPDVAHTCRHWVDNH